MCLHCHEHAEPRHEGDHRGTAVAHQGQRDTHNRQQSDHHAGVDEDIDEEHQGQAAGEHAAVGVRGIRGNRQASEDDEEIENQ